MIHNVFIGHFERDAAFIRFARVTDEPPFHYRPVVSRPIEANHVHELLTEFGHDAFPLDWGMDFDPVGYIVWDRFTGNKEASAFVIELVKRTDCELADYSSLTMLSVESLSHSRVDSPPVVVSPLQSNPVFHGAS